ncbi:hypothetical protein FJR45_06075 [Sulfurimonas sediminis]|uniref:Uncharacterized protein n=1 Tax=Sulfurimonas sediminis TaxID=2590020 RepID=A0A7M1B1M7_9BACT|nr:hypothetical protein [Sulfurimonas sediminis]QOP43540.1 hypothetical protein FJR45_06075 [Sulfurimonas sediminis]
MSHIEKLEELLTKSVIPDITERLDEIFEEIAGSKEATQDAKEEIEELREFKSDLEDVVEDIKNGDMEEEEAKELVADILAAQECDTEEDFGFKDEEEN